MPLLDISPHLRIDYTDEGSGPPVILVHSAVSGNRQWRLLAEKLSRSNRVVAVNLYGYGETTRWPQHAPQSFFAQAQLVLHLADMLGEPVHLCGHSFGGSVAIKAAMLLGDRVKSMALYEPNPFWLLDQHGCADVLQEALQLRDNIKTYGALGDWERVAVRFTDYWVAPGAWASMTERRRAAFLEALPNNYYEWDCLLSEKSTMHDVQNITARTLVMFDPATRRPLVEITRLLRESCPAWEFREVHNVGHMAPLTHPEIVNEIIKRFVR